MCMGILPTYMQVHHMRAWCLRSEMGLDSLEMELQAIVSH